KIISGVQEISIRSSARVSLSWRASALSSLTSSEVERVHGAHQSFERIARECFVTLVGQSQTDASPVRFRSLSDQVPTCLKCLDSLRRSATGGRLKRRECRRGSGEGIGAGEVAERHPLGGAEFAVIALSLHRRGSSVRSDGIVLTMLLCSASGISAIC